MIKFTKIYFLMFLVFGAQVVFAQQMVSGKITDAEDKMPLPGVNIVEKGTLNGTISDYDGNYSIEVAGDATLVFSFVGYISQEVVVGSSTKIQIILQSNVENLSELVVVGYGSQDKKDLSSSVVALDNVNFNKGVLTSPQDMLTGKVAGVVVNSTSGAPGASSVIRIRGGASINGSNDPLIVVDGFPLDNPKDGVAGLPNILGGINPSDVESFTVLKDASATAIYGLRASNGVIIITTKKSKEKKMQFSYDGNVGINTPVRYQDVMKAADYKATIQDLVDRGISGVTSESIGYLGNEDTDWQKQIYEPAISFNNNLSIAGRFKTLPYRVSFGNTNEKGILKTSNLNRNSWSVNANPTFFNGDLQVNISYKGSITKTDFGNTDAIGAAINMDPTQPIINNNTKYGGYFTWTTPSNGEILPDGEANQLAVSNPVALLAMRSNQSVAMRNIGTIQFDYLIPKMDGLRANLVLGLDKTNSNGHDNIQSNAPWTFRNSTSGGQKGEYSANNESLLLDFYLDYTKETGRSKVNVTAGYSYQSFIREGQSMKTSSDGKTIIGDEGVQTDSNTIEPLVNIPNYNNLLSFFGRVNYSFKDRYLITATVRNDYSSRFSKSNRSGIFPSAAVSWKIANEDFMSSLKNVISTLKVRISYGKTGQQDLGDDSYPYLATYTTSTGGATYNLGGTYYPTIRPNPYDPDIKWETTATLDLGLDFGIYKDRITGSIDLYNRETNDMLNTIPVPQGSNFSDKITTNVGSMTNKGVEIMLNAIPIQTNNITWNAGLNYTHNENEISKLIKTDEPDFEGISVGGIAGGVGNTVQNINIGYPSNSFFMFQQVYDDSNNPIDGLYVDRSGQGGSVSGNNLNKYHYKSPRPVHLIGINSRLNFKQWDFSFSGRFSIGNYVYNNFQSENGSYFHAFNNSFFSNLPIDISKTGFVNSQYWSDLYVENASFFKMDFITLGYTLNKSLSKRNLKVRASLTTRNVFFVTKYTGIDPEVESGIDYNIYPRARTILFGLNFSF